MAEKNVYFPVEILLSNFMKKNIMKNFSKLKGMKVFIIYDMEF